ncbi:MAG: tetratricopeptide repeat protein, partial [Chloroflexales bacterium]|nr:tetratricopeptide repeat protein [Chloroflexales bacterium]
MTDNNTADPRLAPLCQEAEAARTAGDLPAAAFGYAAAASLLPAEGAERQAYDLRLARAICLHGAGDYAAEAEELALLETLAIRLGDPSRRIAVALRRANLLMISGDAAAAQLLAAVTLSEARARNDPTAEADSLFALAEAAYYMSDRRAATIRVEQALAAYIGTGNRRGEAYARRLLGLATLGANRASASEHLHSSLEICRSIADRAGEALALNAIGLSSADRAEARAVYIQGLAIAESIGDRESEAMLANNLGIAYLSLGLYGQAQAYAGRAVRLARAFGARDLLAICLETLGRAYGGIDQTDQARVALREAYGLAESLGNRSTAASTLICLARAALAGGHAIEAAHNLDSAAVLYASLGASADEANALAWRGAAHLLVGEVEAARAVTARAVALIEYGSAAGASPPQEVWWQRYRALAAQPADVGADNGDPAAEEALGRAGAALYAAIATLSDTGLRRSYLGRVSVNRAIVEALARSATDSGAPPAAPPPASHVSLQNQLTRILGVTARLNDLHDAAALRELFLDEVVELSGAERLMLLVGPSIEAPEAIIGRGLRPDALPALHAAALPLLRQAMRRRRALAHEDPGEPEGAEPPALRARSAIAVPLISGARTGGARYADVRAFFGPFTAGDLNLIGLLAAQAATALENAHLYAQTLRAKEDLERQVAERTTDLQAANRALEARAGEAQAARAAAEAASAAKSAFLANVSHELRTPLNAVLGFAQVLERDADMTARQRELVQIIARSGNHLLGLINDVLELSKVEAGRLSISPAPFDLRGTLADLEGLFRLRADVRHLNFTVRSSPTVPHYVIGDEGRLRQILINLISNALKFTHGGGITVEADAHEHDG